MLAFAILICNNVHMFSLRVLLMSLKHVVLTALHQHGNLTGYDINKEFDRMLGFFWRASHQQVYRELGKLVEEKLVTFSVIEQLDKPDKKVYTLTVEGRNSLQDWLASPIKPKGTNDELLVRLLGSELLGFENTQALVSQQREHHEQLLQSYLAIEQEILAKTPLEKMSQEFRIFYLPLRRGIHVEKAWLAWADEVDEALSLNSKSKS
jgi:PadR family transcriptional regulator AphA